MVPIITLYDKYVLEQRRLRDCDTDSEITSIGSISQNINENVKKMLKSSFEVLTYQLNTEGEFSKQNNNNRFKKLEIKMLKMLEKIKEEENKKDITDIKFHNNIALALAAYNFGIVYANRIRPTSKSETEYYTKSNDYFKSCQDLLTGKELDRKVILLYMKAFERIMFNQIRQQKFKDYYQLLLRIIRTYINYTQNNKYLTPIDVEIVLLTELCIDDKEIKKLDTKTSLDAIYTQCLINGGIMFEYNKKVIDMSEYVVHMHEYVFNIILNTLIKRKFPHEDYKVWITAAILLFQYFVKNKRFIEARNYLAAISYIVEKDKTEHLEATMKEETTLSDNQNSTEKFDSMYDTNQHQCAKLSKLWGQYGLQLLSASKKSLLQNVTNDFCQTDNLEHSDSPKSNKEVQKMLIFSDLGDKLKETITLISDEYLLKFDDFKTVFEKILKWFNRALEYFTAERNIKTYGEIILQMSLAYKYFVDIEQKDKRLKMYEEQLALLCNAIKKVSDSTTINDIKKLMLLELGICYATITYIKIDNNTIKTIKDTTNQKMLLEVKNDIQNSLNFLMSFLKCS